MFLGIAVASVCVSFGLTCRCHVKRMAAGKLTSDQGNAESFPLSTVGLGRWVMVSLNRMGKLMRHGCVQILTQVAFGNLQVPAQYGLDESHRDSAIGVNVLTSAATTQTEVMNGFCRIAQTHVGCDAGKLVDASDDGLFDSGDVHSGVGCALIIS